MCGKSVILLLVINPVLSQDSVWSLYQKRDSDFTNSSSCADEVIAFESHTKVTSQIECLGLCSRDERCVWTKYNESTLVCDFFDSNQSCENNFGDTEYEKVISFNIEDLVDNHLRRYVLNMHFLSAKK